MDTTSAFLVRTTSSLPTTINTRTAPTHLFSTVIDKPATVEKEKTIEILKDDVVEEEKKYGGEGWEIRLWNDPVNKREFVARCLSTICGKSDTESYQIMMQAHKNGYVITGLRWLFYKSIYERFFLSLFFFLGEFDDKTSFSFPLLTIL
jgi:ATP-dependent Clp protease adapter protein ClpS